MARSISAAVTWAPARAVLACCLAATTRRAIAASAAVSALAVKSVKSEADSPAASCRAWSAAPELPPARSMRAFTSVVSGLMRAVRSAGVRST
jgi:hypothetical protein